MGGHWSSWSLITYRLNSKNRSRLLKITLRHRNCSVLSTIPWGTPKIHTEIHAQGSTTTWINVPSSTLIGVLGGVRVGLGPFPTSSGSCWSKKEKRGGGWYLYNMQYNTYYIRTAEQTENGFQSWFNTDHVFCSLNSGCKIFSKKNKKNTTAYVVQSKVNHSVITASIKTWSPIAL